MLKVEERERQSPRCPFCHGDIARGALWECPGCGTAHHDECAREARRCTVLGCRRPHGGTATTSARPDTAAPETTDAPATRDGSPVLAVLLVVVPLLAVSGFIGLGVRNNREAERSLRASWDRQAAFQRVLDAILAGDLASARAHRRSYELTYAPSRATFRSQLDTYVRSSASLRSLEAKRPEGVGAFLDQVFRDD